MALKQLHFKYGSEAELRALYADAIAEPEEIHSAAVRHPDGIVYCVSRPGRHHHVLGLIHILGKGSTDTAPTQGFLTTHGRFVGRSLAAAIAFKAEQLKDKTIQDIPHVLFSEDLW